MPFTGMEKTKEEIHLGKREAKRPVLDIKFEMLIEHQMEVSGQQLDKYRAQGKGLGWGGEHGIYQHKDGI